MVENGKETIVNIDDEIPFDIPESWAWCRLGNLGEYKKGPFGSAITKSIFIEDTGSNPKVYEQKNAIYKNSIIGSYYITEEKFLELISFELNPDDIIVSCAGTIGETFIMPSDMRRGIMNQALMRVRLYNLQICKFYLIYFDLVLKKQSRLKGKGTAITNIPPLDILKKYLIPLPPLEEQKRIVEAIENLTNNISQIDGESSLIEEKISLAKCKLLDLAIKGKLLPQNPNDEPASKLLERIRKEKESAQLTSKSKRKTAVSYIFKGEDNLYYEKIGNSVYLIDDELPCKLPDNWQWAQFSDICDLYTGNSISKEVKAKKYTNLNNGYNYIGTKDVGFDNQINYNNGVKIPFVEMGFKIAPKNAVLLCIEGGSAGRKIGVTREDVCFGNKLCCFYSKTICNEFIYIYLQSPLFKKLFKESLMGLIGGVGTGSLEKIYVPIPPINEQKRISNFLDKAFEQLDALIQH